MTWPAERASMAREDRAYRLRQIRNRIVGWTVVAFFFAVVLAPIWATVEAPETVKCGGK